MDKPNNPPAFPRTGEGFGNSLYDTPGMSLRDWFAGQALAGGLANTDTTKAMAMWGSPGSKIQLAEWAYAHADAMLAERERRQ